MYVVCNSVGKGRGEKNKLQRHAMVKKKLSNAALFDAELRNILSSYPLQILAWTRKEGRRRFKILLEKQPGYDENAPEKSEFSVSWLRKEEGKENKKPRSESTRLGKRKRADDNDDDDMLGGFIVNDDEEVSDESDDELDLETDYESEQSDNESDEELERMLEEEGYDTEEYDINLDSEDESD